MKRKINFGGLVAALITALVLGAVGTPHFGVWGGALVSIVAFGLMVAKPFLPFMSNSVNGFAADIEPEVWENDIEEGLWDDNGFLLESKDASQYVMQGKVVHIPQGGAASGIEVDRSSLPASVTERTDTDITYTLHSFTSNPILVKNVENFQLSYDKRNSVIGENRMALNEAVAEYILISWAPTATASIIRTTGTSVGTHVTGTTGQRAKFLPKDLKNAAKVLDKQKVSKNRRVCLMSADMYDQFTDGLSETQAVNFANTYDPKTGIVGRLYGFTIYTRAETVVYNTGATACNAYGAAVAATDNDAVLCWQADCVERAVGDVHFFNNPNDPTYYGEVSSFEAIAGGRKRRTAQEGVVAIVQGTVNG